MSLLKDWAPQPSAASNGTQLQQPYSQSTVEIGPLAQSSLGALPSNAPNKKTSELVARAADGAQKRLKRLQRHLNGSQNPFVAQAAPLLDLILVINEGASHAQPQALRAIMRSEIEGFHAHISRMSLPQKDIDIASYALCCALDEAVLSTEWGGNGDWRVEPLLWHFHNDSFGGEVVFETLNDLVRIPEQHLDLLELMAILLDLGFEGHHRIMPNGDFVLNSIRARLYEILRAHRADRTPQIFAVAPVQAQDPMSSGGKVTTALMATVLLFLTIYLGFFFHTRDLAAPALERLETIQAKYALLGDG